MGDWTRQHEHSWPTLDALTWPVRRWVCDRLVGQHAYSRNVWAYPKPVWQYEAARTTDYRTWKNWPTTLKPFDHEESA